MIKLKNKIKKPKITQINPANSSQSIKITLLKENKKIMFLIIFIFLR